MAEAAPPADDPLAPLRARDLARRDPVRFRLAEALARRAAAQEGAVRAALDTRLALLVARLCDGVEPAPSADAAPSTPPASAAPGPLAELAAHAARQKGAPVFAAAVARPPAGERAAAPAGAATDARTLQFFKRTWSRLSADQRLAQSRAALPENAGPLNSQHLVHRALTRMHAVSPAYLERFVGYIDALQWLERAEEASPLATARRAMAARR